MPKNTQSQSTSQVARETFVISLLTSFCATIGHTLSWYSSKKGRNWITLKCNDAPPYSTSVEYTASADWKNTLDTFAILGANHIPKHTQVAPPVTTWHSGAHSQADIDQAWQEMFSQAAQLLAALAEHGQAIPEPIANLLGELGITVEPQA